MRDSDILEKIQKGDESALDYLYSKHFRMMAKMVMKNSGTEEEARDIFQDALIVFWKKVIAKELVLTSKISTYLYSICQNLWRKELEKKKRYSSEEKDIAETPNVDRKEQVEIVNRVISNLGDTCKKVLMYYYFDGLSMQDIADKMGFANSDTAKTKKYKCKQEIDKKIKSLYTASDFLD